MISGSGRSPGQGNGNPLQHSHLENPMDRGAWWAAARVVAESGSLLVSPHWVPFWSRHGARHTVSKRQWEWNRPVLEETKGPGTLERNSLESHPASCLGRSQPLPTSLSSSGELPSSWVWTQRQPPGPRLGRGQCQKGTWLPRPFLETGLLAQCCRERWEQVWRVPCIRAPLTVQLEASL